ncbi:MAG: hypothetical protein GY711_13100 [bacterium]|nr:hypothetical protein [bacterium]
MNIVRCALTVLTLCLLAPLLTAQGDDALHVFIRAGVKTHGPGEHDHPRFLAEWTEELRARGARVEGAQRFPSDAELARADVLVMYAANAGSIHGAERALLERFLGRGGGIVVIHDAVCGDAPHWFKTVVGGAWEHGHAKWKIGEMGLYFPDREHPITRGVSNFDLVDEIYHDLHVEPEAHVLASSFRTTHDIEPQMWTYEKDDYRAFVSIPGHYHDTFALQPFRTILLRGIAWAGKRDANLLVSAEEVAGLRYPDGGPLHPGDAAGPLITHDDFELDLVAAEPLIVNPISLDWDERGRMWVALTPGYPYKEKFSGVAAHDSVVILEDTDRDGALDARKVFHDGLDLVTSVLMHRDGVLVTAAPDILWLRDTDGDDVCDEREVLYSGFGFGDTHAVISNMRWGLDGWVYATQGYSGNASQHIVGADGVDHGKIGNGLLRFRPDGSAIEMVTSYGSNTWGLDFGWDGELFFTMANGSHLRHVVLPDPALARGRVGNAPSWVDVTDHKKAFPATKHERHPYLQIDYVGGFTGAAGCLIYEGGAWPSAYQGDHFVTEPTINLVHRDVLTPSGATFRASKPREAEFLAARDLWFRPVHLRVGPDGALYVLDFYNQAAVHNDTRGPRHGPTNAAVRPDRDRLHGRIWRVQHERARVLDRTSLRGADEPRLVAALRHPNREWRTIAQRLLCERESLSAATHAALFPRDQPPHARLHALWIEHQQGALGEPHLLAALRDDDAGVRKNAARVAGLQASARRAGDDGESEEVAAELRSLLADADARVRIEAAVALEALPLSRDTCNALMRAYARATDDWMRSAIVGTAASEPLPVIVAALSSDDPAGAAALIGELAYRLGRTRDAAGMAGLVSLLATRVDDQPGLVETALRRLADGAPQDVRPAPDVELDRALGRLLGAERVELAIAALPFAARWGSGGELHAPVDALADRLAATLADSDNADLLRLSCLETLLAIPERREAAATAAARLLEPFISADIQVRVIERLGSNAETSGADVLLACFPRFSAKLREAAFDQLVKRPTWVGRLLDRIEAGELGPRDLGPHRAFRLRNHPHAAAAERAARLFDALQPDPGPVEDVIAAVLPIVRQTPDLKNGELMFNEHCGTCHTFRSAQGNVGPELTGMGVHGPEELLPFILDPNRTVEDSYVEYTVRTWDEVIYGGVLVREDASSVVLRNASGDVTVPREDIETFTSTGRSPMPSGLESIGAAGLRDILGWLAAEYEGYRVVPIEACASASTARGIYDERAEPRTYEFTRFGVHAVAGVPFEILDPAELESGNNVIVLKGGMQANWDSKRNRPIAVELVVGYRVRRLHVLGGVSAWGYPYTQDRQPAVKVTWTYADGGESEELLHDGTHFADWVRRSDVPGSEFVPGILAANSRGQLRRFAIAPARDAIVERIRLESFDGKTAPTFVALTAELPTGVTPPAPDGGDIVIVGGGSSHDFGRWFAGTDVRTLAALGAPVQYTEDTGKLAGLIDGARTLYLANNQPLPGVQLRARIMRFVDEGGGLLLVHPALWYNWSDWPEYNRRLVGGGARGHERYGSFEVRVVERDHPVMAKLPERFTIEDELYRFERDDEGADIHVLAIGRSLTSGDEFPVVWTVAREHGRTVCITLGHDGKAHESPEFQALLQQAGAWVQEDGR